MSYANSTYGQGAYGSSLQKIAQTVAVALLSVSVTVSAVTVVVKSNPGCISEDVSVYNSHVKVYAKPGRIDESVNVYNCAVWAGIAINPERIVDSLEIYSSSLMIGEARLLQVRISDSLDIYTPNISVKSKIERVTGVLNIYNPSIKLKSYPDCITDSISLYTPNLRVYTKSERITDSIELFTLKIEVKSNSTTINEPIDVYSVSIVVKSYQERIVDSLEIYEPNASIKAFVDRIVKEMFVVDANITVKSHPERFLLNLNLHEPNLVCVSHPDLIIKNLNVYTPVASVKSIVDRITEDVALFNIKTVIYSKPEQMGDSIEIRTYKIKVVSSPERIDNDIQVYIGRAIVKACPVRIADSLEIYEPNLVVKSIADRIVEDITISNNKCVVVCNVDTISGDLGLFTPFPKVCGKPQRVVFEIYYPAFTVIFGTLTVPITQTIYLAETDILQSPTVIVKSIVDTIELDVQIFAPVIETGQYTIVTEIGGPGWFVGDILQAQRYDFDRYGNLVEIYNIYAHVLNIPQDSRYDIQILGTLSDYKKFEVFYDGIEFARIGNAVNADRQDSIVISSLLPGSPFIDVVDGIDSLGSIGNIEHLKTRIGRLDGLNDPDFPNMGDGRQYGIYTKNIYAKGEFIILNPDGVRSDINVEEGATNGAEWGTNLSGVPNRFKDDVSTTGIYVTPNYMGFYDQGTTSWPIKIANEAGIGKLFVGNQAASKYLSWNGTDLITSGNFYIKNPTQVRSDINVEEGATNGAEWDSNLNGVPDYLEKTDNVTETGIYFTPNHIGFYDATVHDWLIHIFNANGAGQFEFKDTYGSRFAFLGDGSRMTLELVSPSDYEGEVFKIKDEDGSAIVLGRAGPTEWLYWLDNNSAFCGSVGMHVSYGFMQFRSDAIAKAGGWDNFYFHDTTKGQFSSLGFDSEGNPVFCLGGGKIRWNTTLSRLEKNNSGTWTEL